MDLLTVWTVRLAIAGLSAGNFRAANGDEYSITLRLPMLERVRSRVFTVGTRR
jgi:hypothetical protein